MPDYAFLQNRPASAGNSTKRPGYRCTDGQKIGPSYPKDSAQEIGRAARKITGRPPSWSLSLVASPHSNAVSRVQTIVLKHLCGSEENDEISGSYRQKICRGVGDGSGDCRRYGTSGIPPWPRTVYKRRYAAGSRYKIQPVPVRTD